MSGIAKLRYPTPLEELGFDAFGQREPIPSRIDEQITETGQVFTDLGIVGEKIESLNVSKLRAGSLRVDSYIQSTGFVSGTTGWKITGAGDIEAASLTLTGGTIKYQKTGFTDATHAGYYIGSEGIYFGAASDASKLKYTIADGTFDFIGTISSRSTVTIASTIDASGNILTDITNARLNSSAKTILSDFNFGSTDYAGAVKAGDITWNTTTGAITGGSGIAIYRGGIVGAAAGVATFTIDAATGSASFLGSISSGSTITGSTVTGGTIQTATSGQRIRIISAAGTTPTQGANSFALIDSNNAILASIGSDVSASDYVMSITIPASPVGAAFGLNVTNSEATTARTVLFRRSNTDATGQNVLMESSSTGTNLKVDCINPASSGIGIHLDYDALGIGFEIDITDESHGSYAQYINNQGQGYSQYIVHSPATGVGTYCGYWVNQADIAIETLRLNASNAGNTAAPLYLQTGGAISTYFKKLIRGNAITIWESNGNTPNAALSGTAGDICIGADGGKTYYCTGTTTWVAM
jgi:hypothetical protein